MYKVYYRYERDGQMVHVEYESNAANDLEAERTVTSKADALGLKKFEVLYVIKK